MPKKHCKKLKVGHKRHLASGRTIIVCRKGFKKEHGRKHYKQYKKYMQPGHKRPRGLDCSGRGLPSKYIKRYGGITEEGWADYHVDCFGEPK